MLYIQHQVQLVGQCLSVGLIVCLSVYLSVCLKNVGLEMVGLGSLTAVEHLVASPTAAV